MICKLTIKYLKKKIDIIEEEINDSENNFQHISIFNKYYKPLYVQNIKEEEYDKIIYEFSHKIKNIHLGFTKNEIRKREKINIFKFEKKTKSYNSSNNILSPLVINRQQKDSYFNFNSEEGIKEKTRKSKDFFKNIINKKIKKENNNINNLSSQGLYEQKFNDYKNQFNQRFNELNKPIKYLFQKKFKRKIKILPKLNSFRIEKNKKRK